ncbi:sulfate adenylyltransferase subunit CysN [uncultured Algimonas sp.]|uniref:sulfate adenylyltransferase subunit CysN n=1 Tax=uncultured Algimonas sp. TaxID=1547920 RepID=UPI0026129C72|nr:sulfate adenylyltransferase subunit CysN [uncultured Algimonas sp.]
MAHHDPLIAQDIAAYLSAQERKSFLRVFTCGSVDDGKSTLIGRLLYDSKLIYEDQMAAIEKDSKTSGTTGEKPDLALLVDGLAAEREQGITIDVAYRFFSTDKRKFIIADTPGHVQYTRNMATGASTADVAVLLIDARYGVVEQTRRHAFIASLLGIPQVVVAVNKMDLVGFDQSVFNDIDVSFRAFASELRFADIMTIPVSALDGDNVTTSSDKTAWYKGPSLLGFLEDVRVDRESLEAPFRLPVQWVNRPNLDFRGFAGTIASGTVSKGQEVITLPSGKRSAIKDILLHTDSLDHARQGQSVTLTLEDEIDVSRGDMLCGTDRPPEVADQFQAHLIWMDDKRLFPGRQYIIRTANSSASGSVTSLKHRTDIEDLSEAAAKTLNLNEIGVVTLSLSKPIPFDPYTENRKTGAFIVVDRTTNRTVGAGMIDFALRRAHNIVRQDLIVDRIARASQKGQQPTVLWFTGLSGSGKSTIANLVDEALFERGHHTYTLDGDNVRHGLNRDLGFTKEDRIENIRRIGEVAKLMSNAGLIVMCSFISPYRAERRMVRDMLGENEFFEIFIDTPLDVAEERDVKGLYKRARAGEIKNFTGIDSEYQPPDDPDLRIDTTELSPEDAADRVLELLRSRYRLDDPANVVGDGGGI